jgi:proliferating cell nuclear antigen
MLNVVLAADRNAETFCALFQHLRTFTDTLLLFWDAIDGMYMQCLDTSHVSIVEMELPRTFFTSLTCDNGRIAMGVSTTLLARILGTRSKAQQIQWTLGQDVLTVSFTGDSKSDFDKEYTLPLVDIEQEQLSIPSTDYQAEFTLASSHLASLVQQMQWFGDTAQLQCTEEAISWCSRSLEGGAMKVEMAMADLIEYAIDENETVQGSFALKYLSHLCAYHKLVPQVHLGVSRQAPLRARYILDATGDAHLTFHLAPKIGDDEEG